MTQWQKFVKNQLRLGGHEIVLRKPVCIDIEPYGTSQAQERNDILNIGDFSDAVFNVVASFLSDDKVGVNSEGLSLNGSIYWDGDRSRFSGAPALSVKPSRTDNIFQLDGLYFFRLDSGRKSFRSPADRDKVNTHYKILSVKRSFN